VGRRAHERGKMQEGGTRLLRNSFLSFSHPFQEAHLWELARIDQLELSRTRYHLTNLEGYTTPNSG